MQSVDYIHGVTLTEDELRLVRLFRCLDQYDQHLHLISITQEVMYNFSVDPQIVRSGKIAKDVLVEELSPDNVEEYDDRLLSAWPADWPGRTFVDLDNVGDPSVWLSGSLPEGACSQIMGSSTYDGDTADDLTNAYTCAQDENYFPLPNEFGVTDDIMMATIRDDFIGLIKEWRRRVMDTIDRQRSLA